jgi:hypothetical protein
VNQRKRSEGGSSSVTFKGTNEKFDTLDKFKQLKDLKDQVSKKV